MTALDLNQHIIMKPRHRFDIEAAKVIKQQFAQIDGDRYPIWAIDLKDVEFIDSSGLGALAVGHKTARQRGCRLLIFNLQPTVRLIFEITQLDRVFEIVDGLDAVLSQDAKLAA